MKRAIAMIGLWLLSFPALGVVEIGERVPNICYRDVRDYQICMDFAKGTVRVLVYSTGWCPGCKDEIRELSQSVHQFSGEMVQFYSLSSQGESQGSDPNVDFLKKWQKTYQIPFIVASSPRDAGKYFFRPPYRIPATVIIDKEGNLAAKAQGMTVSEIFSKVRELLKK